MTMFQCATEALVLCIIWCMPFLMLAQEHKASSKTEHLLDGQFKLVLKTDSIPTNIKQAFSKITGEAPFAMANPGMKFQVTDVVYDRSLPRRRLVFAGVQGETWFVHYERGGLAHSYFVVAFNVKAQDDVNFAWGCGIAGAANSIEQLRRMVATCRLSGADSYW
jgi:hypothetical protein